MPKDPIPNIGTDTGRELFAAFVVAAKDRPVDDVLNAAMNIIANCLRQNYGRRSEVEARMKELYGRGMEILLEHYDPNTGRRRSVIPFDQTVRANLIFSDDDHRRH